MSLLLLLLGCPPAPPDSETPKESGSTAFQWPDPLSTPTTPTLDVGDFSSASTCKSCHPSHYQEWTGSPHAWAMQDPVFQALVGVRQDAFAGEQDAFCVQCHSSIATRGGEVAPGFSFDDLSPVVMEGVTCEACHKVSEVLRPYNSGHQLDPTGPLRGGLEEPMENGAHRSQFSTLFGTAEFCAGCHDVMEINGLDLERPYAEWQQTPAGAEGRPCQSCHMPTVREPAAVGGPARDRHSHRFVGVDLPLKEGLMQEEGEAELRAAVQTLLTSAASLMLDVPQQYRAGEQVDLRVSVHNNIDAHSFPTGTTFLRQCWLELVVTDAEGRTVFTTGDLDPNGDLKDRWSSLEPYGDPNLISFSSGFLDQGGQPTLFTHLATEHSSNAIGALYTRTLSYFVQVPSDVTGDLTVRSRLRFRAIAPHLLRLLDLPELVDRVEVFDVDVVECVIQEGQ